MQKATSIGYLIPEFPGQTHSFFWREIQTLEQQHGYKVQIFSTQRPPQKVAHEWLADVEADYLFPPKPHELFAMVWGGLGRLHRVLGQTDARTMLRTPKHWALLLMAVKLGQACARTGVTHLHVHSCADSAIIAAFCNIMYDLPYSIVLHGSITDYGPYQDFKWARARFAFVVSEKLRQEMAVLLPETAVRTQVAPMGVNTEVFVPPPSRLEVPSIFSWFCCARLNRGKGLETLLAAFNDIRKDHPRLSWSLSIAGEDEADGNGYRKVLEEQISLLNLNENVRLLGALPQHEVLRRLQTADGFVLASLQEALGVAYMEAMSCGLPTIGTRVGGVPELIEDGWDGLLVPPKDEMALSKALFRVMTTPELRAKLSRNGRSKIVNKFGSKRSADALSEALKKGN